nr:hypothetical protein Iba_chr09fCG3780 [Ipomoea batatas]
MGRLSWFLGGRLWCILQCPVIAILVDQEPFTMLRTVTYEFNNISMAYSINVVYQIYKLVILLLIADSFVQFLHSKQLKIHRGWTMEPLSLGLLLDTTGGAISSRLGILLAAQLAMAHQPVFQVFYQRVVLEMVLAEVKEQYYY